MAQGGGGRSGRKHTVSPLMVRSRDCAVLQSLGALASVWVLSRLMLLTPLEL